MGIYLNPGNEGFRRAVRSEIYIDKTGLIPLISKRFDTMDQYICVSRPRRFGKSMALDMLAAYYSCGCDSRELFQGLAVKNDPSFGEYLNKYNVIYLDMARLLRRAGNGGIIKFLEKEVLKDLREKYVGLFPKNEVFLPAALEQIHIKTGEYFVFLIDEWDCIMRERPSDEGLQKQYLDFLRDLLKDQVYTVLAYMTGILPIKKYGMHSALNMFSEYSMTDQADFEEYTGFTEGEVKSLCEKYNMDFDEAKNWYDGYSLDQVKHIYNPKSVVEAMKRHKFGNYWTSTETYEALKFYIDINFDGLREAVVWLLGDRPVVVNTGRFKNDMKNLASKDDVLTLLIHLGYLAYDSDTKEVFIPNKEIAEEFLNAMDDEGWKEVMEDIKVSEKLLEDTLRGNEKSVADTLNKAHRDVSSILTYNNEANLAMAIRIAYYSARKDYQIIRELPAGIGFADLAFIPLLGNKPAIIIELKYDKTANTAIKQIKDNKYPEVLSAFSGEIILVGINYDKDTKVHTCKIEKIKNKK